MVRSAPTGWNCARRPTATRWPWPRQRRQAGQLPPEARPGQELRRRAGGQGRAPGRQRRRGGRPAGPQRRRQDHLLLHDRRPGARRRRRHPHRRHRDQPACRSTSARAWGCPTCRRKRRSSASSRRGEHARRARAAGRPRRPPLPRARSTPAAGAAAADLQIEQAARFAGAGAVGRRAAAGRDRPRAGHAAALHPARRAVRRRRPDRGDRDPAHHRLPEASAASAC
jgi:hypothetical protein